jgi:hypothetical protein
VCHVSLGNHCLHSQSTFNHAAPQRFTIAFKKSSKGQQEPLGACPVLLKLHARTCRSRHEFKRALRVKPAAAFEHHMCPESHCCHVFKDLPRANWRQHLGDVCPACNVGHRFKQKAGHPEASKRCERLYKASGIFGIFLPHHMPTQAADECHSSADAANLSTRIHDAATKTQVLNQVHTMVLVIAPDYCILDAGSGTLELNSVSTSSLQTQQWIRRSC